MNQKFQPKKNGIIFFNKIKKKKKAKSYGFGNM